MALSAAAMTDADVRTLMKGATDDDRAAAAHKLCRNMERQALSDEERRAAQDILRVMAADAAELVRRALAVTLRSSPLLPRDVALRLATDTDSVALPVLNWSPAFTDEDLVALVRTVPESKQVAVARRPRLSERVTGALAESGAEAAVREACANDNAQFDERGLRRAVDRFPASDAVHAAIAHRRVLPLAIAERLVTLASDAVRQHLVAHHAVSTDTAVRIAAGTRERATYDLVEQGARASDLPAFCAHLHKQARLTPSLLLRAVASGHVQFFEHGLAELAGTPHHRAWLLIHDAGPLGLKAICERAGVPDRLYPAFPAGLDACHSMALDGGSPDRERFQERVLQRFLTQAPPAGREDIDYLLDRMDRLTSEARVPEHRRGAA